MVEATEAERGRKPLHAAMLIAIAVVSAFVLLMAAADIAQDAAVKHSDRDLKASTSHKPYSRT